MVNAETNADGERDRIVEAAMQLFSALGFDATTTELIADSAGVDTATVRTSFRSNAELYRAVMRRAAKAEQAALREAVEDFTPTRQAMNRLLDDYLDLYAARPDLLGLWLHRRTGDAADTADIDEHHVQPRLSWLVDSLREHVLDPGQLDYALWSFPWVVSGFLGHGMIHTDEKRSRGPGQPVTDRELEAFRTYLHTMADRLLGLPDAQ
ncbi:TetR/AcrR family transcriptional regulator [Actinomadura rudentiformis]|uniref:TetR/AcrR family transcriptional regulator n=1 Tax=Actinomadura rudentiformis TaxID=359158 RepID=A0A6H9YVX0_9ACTN|nr:TetR/AcrR family transcriptional regulator [Actinomadura rudentiformis]KAB2345899.1 TetR/AcrR family transcriptional regulator [Actinomadura rudentiformis]